MQGILDYMDNLTLQQIRRLFHLLSRLAFGPQQQGAHIQVHLHRDSCSFFSFTSSLTSLLPPGWHAHRDPQAALQHFIQVQTHRHHRGGQDGGQHGSTQVKAVSPRQTQQHFLAHPLTLSFTLSSDAGLKRTHRRHFPQRCSDRYRLRTFVNINIRRTCRVCAPAGFRSQWVMNVCVFLVAGISPAGAGEVEQWKLSRSGSSVLRWISQSDNEHRPGPTGSGVL